MTPLSAVDPEVGHKIFQECICGALKGKTILLATHGLHFLNDSDRILHMMNGEITEEGTFDELIAAGGDFASLLAAHGVTKQSASPEAKSPTFTRDDKNLREDQDAAARCKGAGGAGGLTTKEEREEGGVQLPVLKAYVQATGGMWVPVVTVLGILGSNLALVASDYWLGILSRDGMGWRSDVSEGQDHWEYYIYVYIAWLPIV
eukprot:COSAG06_NODE_12571_length_1362_cov_0.608076_3_plen_203_part_01